MPTRAALHDASACRHVCKPRTIQPVVKERPFSTVRKEAVLHYTCPHPPQDRVVNRQPRPCPPDDNGYGSKENEPFRNSPLYILHFQFQHSNLNCHEHKPRPRLRHRKHHAKRGKGNPSKPSTPPPSPAQRQLRTNNRRSVVGVEIAEGMAIDIRHYFELIPDINHFSCGFLQRNQLATACHRAHPVEVDVAAGLVSCSDNGTILPHPAEGLI